MQEYADRVVSTTLGLPAESHADLPLERYAADLHSASDLLMARSVPANEDLPSVELVVRKVLEDFTRLRAERGLPTARIWYYPEPKPFAAFLSHDVDEVRWSWRRRLLMAARHPSARLDHRKGYWNFERVMALEDSYGLRSSFYVVPSGSHRRDPPYRLAALAAVVHSLSGGGWEVGVHGSFESFDKPGMLTMQKRMLEALLGRSVTGVRQHFINFTPPLTWKIQEDAGFVYDSTVASRDRPGFRVGICHPYRPEGLRLLEIPLTVMDGQLFWYEKLDAERAYERTMGLIRTVASFNGVACLNWHQHTMDELSFPGWWDAFRRCLEDLRRMDPWFATGSDLATWWNRRAEVQFREVSVSKGSAIWTLADPVGGPLTLRIDTRSLGRDRIRIEGTDEYEILPVDAGAWVHFRNLPSGTAVKVSVEPAG